MCMLEIPLSLYQISVDQLINLFKKFYIRTISTSADDPNGIIGALLSSSSSVT